MSSSQGKVIRDAAYNNVQSQQKIIARETITGSLKVRNGAQDGYVLTSDQKGNARWRINAGADQILVPASLFSIDPSSESPATILENTYALVTDDGETTTVELNIVASVGPNNPGSDPLVINLPEEIQPASTISGLGSILLGDIGGAGGVDAFANTTVGPTVLTTVDSVVNIFPNPNVGVYTFNHVYQI